MAYLLFVGITAAIYYLVPRNRQWIVLLVFSYLFYMASGPRLVLFLLMTTLTTWISALMIEQVETGRKTRPADAGSGKDENADAAGAEMHDASAAEQDKAVAKAQKKLIARRQKTILTICLLFNFGVLFMLKYVNFVHWALPLGISFYTFQSLGYVIDVYWKRVKAEHSLPRYMLFVSFFPQILQGPIGRHSRLAVQFEQPHSFDLASVQRGLQRMCWGYFIKFVVADRAGDAVSYIVSGYQNLGGAMYLVAVLMYSLQLYGDFAGGMDVVIGTAEIFGIRLDENFRQPYFANSISDFWHRWHITLGTWMKDYLFYPLSLTKSMQRFGKAVKKKWGKQMGRVLPVMAANLVVFLAVGVWHGSGGKYLAYGIYNGLLVSLEAFLEPYMKKLYGKLGIGLQSRGLRIFQIVRTFLLVNLSWFWDIAPDMKTANAMMRGLITDFHIQDITMKAMLDMGINRTGYLSLLIGTIILFAADLLREKGHDLRNDISTKPLPIRWAIWLFLIFFTITFGKYSAGGFIYAQF